MEGRAREEGRTGEANVTEVLKKQKFILLFIIPRFVLCIRSPKRIVFFRLDLYLSVLLQVRR